MRNMRNSNECDSRDYFDHRPGLHSTITELSMRAGILDYEQWIPREILQKRTLIFTLYGDYRDEDVNAAGGFLVWKKYPNIAGIEGYRCEAALTPYQQYAQDAAAFIEQALRWDQTLCFIGADQRTAQLFKEVLDECKHVNLFHPQMLKYGLALPLTYPQTTISTPLEIQGMIEHPSIRLRH